MQEAISTFVTTTVDILSSIGPIGGIILVVLESIIPILPVSVFITLNMASYGMIFGFFISWLSTILGCMISFCIFRYLFQNKVNKYIKKKNDPKLNKVMKMINNIEFSNLVVFIAIPFSPAFLINIAGGLSKIDIKKFFIAIVIGKIIMVYFWGYIGTSLLESLTDITIIFKIAILLVVAFVLSKIVEKKLKVK